MKNKKLIVIAGPTASGKSDLGIELAKKYDGEIISADSRQVYQKMDLGTGKVETEPADNLSSLEQKLGKCYSEGVVHYLLDVADPRKEVFNMAKFKQLADQAIEHIYSQKKLPFLVGGSMLYLDAVAEGYQPAVKSDPKLRKELEGKNISELQKILKKEDSKASEKIDVDNKVRVIRAIEVKRITGESILDSQEKKKPEFATLKLGISLSRKELYKGIDKRVDIRVDQGMIEEVKMLHDWGVSWERMDKFGLEYRFLSKYLKGELSKEEALEQLKFKTHNFARKQLTWWRRDKEIIWIKGFKEANQKVKEFLC